MNISDLLQLAAIASVIAGIAVLADALFGMVVAIGVCLTLAGAALWLVGQELDRAVPQAVPPAQRPRLSQIAPD